MSAAARRLPDDDDDDGEIERLFALARGDSSPARDLLQDAFNRARSMLKSAKSTKERVHILWAAAKSARDLGASDVVHELFTQLAIEVNLIDRSGRWTGSDVRESRRPFGEQDVQHVISWALRGLNPFEKGPLT